MRTLKRLNRLKFVLRVVLALLVAALLVLITFAKNALFYCASICIILIAVMCHCIASVKKRERRNLAKSVLKLVSSILKQGGEKKYSLKCEIVESRYYISFEITIEDSISDELYLKCQENVLEYLESYGDMKRKLVEVNIIQAQMLIAGDLEG